ncbi:MFS sugar transporter (plasmid) [Roseomonas gilardii]|uniref:MFS sugar transporter n=1 Tax=Roseomonas gilardii TaxID=257708 RepID=A0A1L7ANN7_9PROT|nr:MFS transporter [Roseomonas gilardii]APT60359.1 MFS sugar transporter [Roseomonas gilardii]
MDDNRENLLLKRIAWRLVPLLTIIYLIAYIDRANISYAKLTMVQALHITEAEFGFAASLFFIGYLIFEVPSNLALNYFGARPWIARIMFTWGLATVLTAFVSSSTFFLIVRFIVGTCEAGLYPGLIFYLSLWFPQKQRTGIVGLLTLGSSLGNMFGSLIGGYSLELDGLFGFQGWQWVFLITGMPAVLMTFVTLLYLPNSPQEARFITDEERNTLDTALRRDPPPPKPAGGAPWTLGSLLTVLALSAGYGTISVAIYGIAYWLPTLVKGFGVSSGTNGLLNMVPWALASVVLFWLPRRLRSFRAVLITAMTAAALGIALFLISVSPVSNALRFTALALGAPTLYLMIPCFWATPPRLLPSAFLKGSGGAAAMAVIVSGSGLGGFVAQNLMPWIAQASGSASAPMIAPAVSLLLLGLAAFVVLLSTGNRRDVEG